MNKHLSLLRSSLLPRTEFWVCRYSIFVGASLLITFVTLSASLLRTLHLVHDLAACSRPDSKCLYDVQRYVYKRLVRNFVKVDAETLELQATGVCRSANNGALSSIDLLDSDLATNLLTAEVCCSPRGL